MYNYSYPNNYTEWSKYTKPDAFNRVCYNDLKLEALGKLTIMIET